MDDGKSDVLQEFCAITGVDDVAAAMNVLEATNWVLEDAINLQFASGGGLGGDSAAGGNPASSPVHNLPNLQEEDVRAPLPVMRDRLYGDASGMHGISTRAGMPRYGAARPPDRGPTHIDVFQNFQPAQASDDAATTAAAAPVSSHANPSQTSNALSSLFKPPEALLFLGDFEAAKARAADQGRWLLVNLQTADEFASHRLNRDTWSNQLVQDMIRESFVFWQGYVTSEQGGAIVMQYHIEEFPAVFIVDPITGAQLWQRPGFVSPDSLIEELVPFLDMGPHHPDAHKLAQRFAQTSKRRHKPSTLPAPAEAMSEEEQLALALAMSVEGGAAAEGLDDVDEKAIWQEIQKRQKQDVPADSSDAQPPQQAPAAAPPAAACDVPAVQAAAARLPPEPAAGQDSCRVAFRLPDGSRVQRTFATSDTVATLQDFVMTVSQEAVQMGGFSLCEARPGSSPLDPAASIQAAGVAGAMLVIRPC